jgi:hypothetical protein
MKRGTLEDLIIIAVSTIVITFLVWLPHLFAFDNFYNLNFSEGFNTIYRNFDGLEYVIIAKTFYNPEALKLIPQSLPHEYYAAHFPGYSLAMLVFAPLLGFLKAMLLVSLLFTIASAMAFYFLVKHFNLTEHPLILSLIFLILPARWLIVHSVGSSEPMFIFFILTSIYFFMKYELHKKWKYIYLAGIMGVFAQLTRPPGILLIAAFGMYLVYKLIKHRGNYFFNFWKSVFDYHPLILVPLSLLGIFYWFQISLGDFFAYFHSGDNIHLVFPPFQVFNREQFWVGEIWLEDIIYILILGYLGVVYLFKKKLLPMAFFALIYLLATSFVAHRDISRYALPIYPFLIIAFEKVLTSKEFRIVLVIVGMAIYLYAQNFLIHNTAPYPNLEAFN